MKLTTHVNSEPYCGAVGPIAYDKGKAWSVNTIFNEVMDWRFTLDSTQHRCEECRRHVAAAKEQP